MRDTESEKSSKAVGEEKPPEEGADSSPEKQEEAKLMAKYPGMKPGIGQSQFLQKRLQHRQKFFDSGDYNMAKAKGQLKLNPLLAHKPKPPTLSVVVDETGGSTSPTGNEIPTPETVPQRKTSLVQPVASKLSPQPIHHHLPDMSPLTTLGETS